MRVRPGYRTPDGDFTNLALFVEKEDRADFFMFMYEKKDGSVMRAIQKATSLETTPDRGTYFITDFVGDRMRTCVSLWF